MSSKEKSNIMSFLEQIESFALQCTPIDGE
jgi:hypothetical protein